MTSAAAIVGYGLREARRRRVFLIVLALTAVFLALYALGIDAVFDAIADVEAPVDERLFAGATMFGLAMFATFFLGTVLAVFLTVGAVRGDAERGLLQPLVVRPVGRSALLVARFLGAAIVCALYVLAVYAAALVITVLVADWTPDRIVLPGLELAAAVAIVAAVSLLGSVFLSPTANGIAVFMVFGAGLTAGLLAQIGEALDSETLDRVATVAAWALPFEALYQDALSGLTADSAGLTKIVVQLGPFGGAEAHGPLLVVWAPVYLALVGAAALSAFARRDL